MKPRQVVSRYVDSLFNEHEPIVQPKPESAPAVKPTKEPIAVFLDGKWYSDGKMLLDCTVCVCLDCANNGKSCRDCRGPEYCMKLGDKIDHCPDYRKEVTA